MATADGGAPGMSVFASASKRGVAFLAGLVVVVTTTGSVGQASSPAAASSTSTNCDPRQAPPPPVLLVHGFLSDAREGWSGGDGPGPIEQALRDRNHAVDSFDYKDHATRWVSHPEIGPRLADRILELGQGYKEQCGDGKVVVVAHSMGGLAARCALAVECGRRENVAEAVGLVITLGTPHLGSHLRDANGRDVAFASTTLGIFATCLAVAPKAYALGQNEFRKTMCETLEALTGSEAGRAFTVGSERLAALPPFPQGVAVRSLAGRINLVAPTWRSADIYDIGDIAVSTQSATALGTAEDYGGSRVIECGLVPVTNYRCHHMSLTKTPEFVQDVLASIRRYETSVAKRAQQAQAAAEAAERAAQRAAAEAGVLPGPRGPVLEITRKRASFPYTMQAIAMQTAVQWGDEPAPAGKQWVAVAVQIRGLLRDRDMPPPDMLLFNFSWPGGCPSNYFDDPYLCNNQDLKRVTDFMPIDATSYDDPRNITADGVIPPGQPVDVVYRALVPEGIDLSRARLKYGLASDAKSILPLDKLPSF